MRKELNLKDRIFPEAREIISPYFTLPLMTVEAAHPLRGMAPSLLSLSDELLVHVVNFIDYPSLKLLALVCRTLNRFATPQIYARVNFKSAHRVGGVKYLIPFTFHLLQNPDLASLVRSFSIRDAFSCEKKYFAPLTLPYEEKYKDDRIGWPAHPDLETILRNAVKDVESDAEEREKLFRNVRDGYDEGSILTILLPKLTSLRKLDLAHDWLGSGSPSSESLA